MRYGGSLSGEHGDGQARAALLEKMYGPELVQAFREFKAIWDPTGRMNPGKVVDPYPITSNLRLGPELPAAEARRPTFSFPNDGSFDRATQRCVGVGKCRRHDSRRRGDVPELSRRPTRRSTRTRGRARLLFEMLHGGPIDDGWRSEAVEDALDLCLACKGCKSDCPVNVDMATYKAEFRAHHYAWRLRPAARLFDGAGFDWVAREAARVPRLANLFTQAPLPAQRRQGGRRHRAAAHACRPSRMSHSRHWFRRRETRRRRRAARAALARHVQQLLSP